MNEPSKEAMAKAREILSPPGAITLVPAHVGELLELVERYENRVARMIQQTSDVAKDALGSLKGWAVEQQVRGSLQSLILPDEKCHHLISSLHIECESLPEVGQIKCAKCGPRLKIVQADD